MQESPSENRRKRLLLVDDDRSVRRVLALGLRVEGYDVAQAANGQEALAYLHDNKVDAVMVDLMMPVMDGRAFLQKAREELGISVPILVLTSVDRAGVADDLLSGGASGILHKPVRVPQIVAKLLEIEF